MGIRKFLAEWVGLEPPNRELSPEVSREAKRAWRKIAREGHFTPRELENLRTDIPSPGPKETDQIIQRINRQMCGPLSRPSGRPRS